MTIRFFHLWVMMLASLMLADSASAQIYKCIGSSGRAIYQQTPCEADNPGGEHRVRVVPPADPNAVRRAKQAEDLRQLNREYQQSLDLTDVQPERGPLPTAVDASRSTQDQIMRCEGMGYVWYSATRDCRNADRIEMKNGYVRNVQFRYGRSVSVSTACEEIRSGAASLQIDTYQRNQGMDPCK